MDVRYNNNAPAQLNDYIRGLLHLGPNVIKFRTLLHLGQLLHKGLQQPTSQNISGLFVMNFTSHVIKRRCPSGFGPPYIWTTGPNPLADMDPPCHELFL